MEGEPPGRLEGPSTWAERDRTPRLSPSENVGMALPHGAEPATQMPSTPILVYLNSRCHPNVAPNARWSEGEWDTWAVLAKGTLSELILSVLEYSAHL